jgi:phage terminase Nu1 subunit (DNA packaging protein)
MPDINAPLRRDDDEPDDRSIEERMRLALGKLGTKGAIGQGGPAGTVVSTQTGAQRRTHLARNGEVLVERVSSPARLAGELGRELAEERALRQRAEQALAEAQASIASLKLALTRSEQVARTARATVEER